MQPLAAFQNVWHALSYLTHTEPLIFSYIIFHYLAMNDYPINCELEVEFSIFGSKNQQISSLPYGPAEKLREQEAIHDLL